MKIRADHYETLRAAMSKVLADSPDAAESYAKQGLSPKRFRWDVLHAAKINDEPSYRFVCDVLYADGLDDSHIDSALRKIVNV